MAIFVGRGSEGNPAPDGDHAAVCIDVVDLGVQRTQFGEKRTVEFRWATKDGNEQGPYTASQRYTASLHDQANLTKMLVGWRGRKFTPEELTKFDLETCVGVLCRITVERRQGNRGGIFANVVNVSRSTEAVPVPEGYVRQKDRPTQVDRPEPYDDAGAPVSDDDIPF